jgi:methionine-rich copper-binding protein CopC
MTRALVAACLCALAAAPAAAHAFLVKSSPARRAVVATPPSQVELEFNERLEPAYSTVSVWNEAGRRVDAGNAGVAANDPRRLVVAVPPLDAGRYTVRFRVLSVDGHIVESSFLFSVAPRGAGANRAR